MYTYTVLAPPPPCCGVQSEAHTTQKKLDRAKYAAESIKRLRMSALCVTRSAGKRKKIKTGRRQRYEMPRLYEVPTRSGTSLPEGKGCVPSCYLDIIPHTCPKCPWNVHVHTCIRVLVFHMKPNRRFFNKALLPDISWTWEMLQVIILVFTGTSTKIQDYRVQADT